MYYIVFIYNNSKDTEVYSGGTYIHQGEKYACFDRSSPKLYKFEKVAENVVEKLLRSCVNTGCDFEIVKKG